MVVSYVVQYDRNVAYVLRMSVSHTNTVSGLNYVPHTVPVRTLQYCKYDRYKKTMETIMLLLLLYCT